LCLEIDRQMSVTSRINLVVGRKDWGSVEILHCIVGKTIVVVRWRGFEHENSFFVSVSLPVSVQEKLYKETIMFTTHVIALSLMWCLSSQDDTNIKVYQCSPWIPTALPHLQPASTQVRVSGLQEDEIKDLTEDAMYHCIWHYAKGTRGYLDTKGVHGQVCQECIRGEDGQVNFLDTSIAHFDAIIFWKKEVVTSFGSEKKELVSSLFP